MLYETLDIDNNTYSLTSRGKGVGWSMSLTDYNTDSPEHTCTDSEDPGKKRSRVELNLAVYRRILYLLAWNGVDWDDNVLLSSLYSHLTFDRGTAQDSLGVLDRTTWSPPAEVLKSVSSPTSLSTGNETKKLLYTQIHITGISYSHCSLYTGMDPIYARSRFCKNTISVQGILCAGNVGENSRLCLAHGHFNSRIQ